MKKTEKLDKNLVGVTGVYYVAAKLSHLGYIALVTTRNTKAYDLLAFKPGERKILPIQVKTRSSGGFRIVNIEDAETINEEVRRKVTCPFILVDLKENPEFYIISQNQMRKLIKKEWDFAVNYRTHRKPIKKTDIQIIFQQRDIMDLLQTYKNAWRNLRLP